MCISVMTCELMFIVINLNCYIPLGSRVSKIALCNPMSDTGCNYIYLLDCNSELNVNQFKMGRMS